MSDESTEPIWFRNLVLAYFGLFAVLGVGVALFSLNTGWAIGILAVLALFGLFAAADMDAKNRKEDLRTNAIDEPKIPDE